MTFVSHYRPQRGFSLIEVMIAVAVLAFGLLALTALQASSIRASAESKARSVAVSLAKDQIEEIRSYRDIAGYQAVDSLAQASAQTFSQGGVDYRRWWAVTRYAYNPTTKAFASEISNTGATPTGYDSNNEFKRVQVTVSWIDATGVTQTTAMEDAVAALDPTDSTKLAKLRSGVTARKPKVIIYNPAGTDGVIPIAIGGGSDTAATNPTPEVTGRGTNNERVVETRFDVLTYAALSGNTSLATAQSRVETAVVGCTCNGSNGGGVTGRRPTYWNGERYSVPVQAAFVAPAGVATGLPVPESPRCTICCRDHHDNSTASPGRVATGQARFDPRRTTHDHYAIDSITSPTVGVLATGDYQESCRIIRVDGIFRVATDAFNDHMDLLETKTGTDGIIEHLPVPSDTAIANYAGRDGFVLKYMGNRFVNGTSYNTRLTMTPSPALHPDIVPISKSIFDYRWQHARGLYIDYLEPEAVARIDQAKADCVTNSCTADGKQTAILKLLPFTSINLSEVANWRSYGTKNSATTESTDLITVTNDDFLESITYPQPVRGNALPGFQIPQSPANGEYEARASAEIFESNSGLALMLNPVDPPEFTPVSDGQKLLLTGTGASASSGTYTVTIPKGSKSDPNGYFFSASSASYPRFGSSPNPSRCTYATKGGDKPNPYTCGNYNLGTTALGAVPINITISKYNYTDTSRTSTNPLTCIGVEGDKTYTGPYPVNYCRNYGLSTLFPVTVSPLRVITLPYTVTNSGLIGESTTVSFRDLRAGDAITMPLRFENESTTSTTCTYQVSIANNGTKSYTYYTSPAACP